MDNSSREPIDSSRISDQPALRSASGTIWVVAGGLFLVVIAAVLAAIISSGGPAVGYAITTIAVVAALYLVLLIARFAIRPGKTRLWVMAGSMIGMAVVALIGLWCASGPPRRGPEPRPPWTCASVTGRLNRGQQTPEPRPSDETAICTMRTAGYTHQLIDTRTRRVATIRMASEGACILGNCEEVGDECIGCGIQGGQGTGEEGRLRGRTGQCPRDVPHHSLRHHGPLAHSGLLLGWRA